MATYEHPSRIVDAFARLVAERANDVMIVSPFRKASFGEINSLSRAVADLVAGAAIEPGRLIGLSAPNGPAFIAGLLALRRAGQAALLLDPLAPIDDRRRAVTAVGAAAVLSCESAWPASAAEFRLARLDTPGPPVFDGTATVKLTSGSTGLPRGVAMREEHLLADEDALARTMGLRDSDCLLSVLPLSHSYGFTTLAMSAVVRGLPIIVPSTQGPFAPLDAARALGATVFPTVPAYLQALLKLSQPPAWPEPIRLVISAGAVLPAQTAAHFRETYGRNVHVFYGSSECGGICYDREGGAAERGTVGTPVEGVSVSLGAMDGDSADEGLVTVSSDAVGLTYLPDKDARLADGRFETSDVATWHGRELALLSRIDRVISLRGRKVDPSEVEKVIEALDGVDEAVVIGISAPGGGEEIVRAVVASTAGQLGYEQVARWCRQRLAEHKVPRSIIIVDAIPRTSRGKIDRAALRIIGSRKDSEAVSG